MKKALILLTTFVFMTATATTQAASIKKPAPMSGPVVLSDEPCAGC